MTHYRSPYAPDPDPWDGMADNLPSPMGERMAALEAPDACADVVTRAQWRAQHCPDPAAHERITLSEAEAARMLAAVIGRYRDLARHSVSGAACKAAATAWGLTQLRERGVLS